MMTKEYRRLLKSSRIHMVQELQEAQDIIFGIRKNEKLNIMINFDDVIVENRQEHNPHWPKIPDQLHISHEWKHNTSWSC